MSVEAGAGDSPRSPGGRARCWRLAIGLRAGVSRGQRLALAEASQALEVQSYGPHPRFWPGFSGFPSPPLPLLLVHSAWEVLGMKNGGAGKKG